MINFKKLLISLAIPLAAGGIGYLLSGNNTQIYESIIKPSFAPPGFISPIAWAILYILMGISYYLIVTSKDNSKTYVISFGSKLKVKDGDEVKAGDPITEGSINPNDLLLIKGVEGVYTYIISEVQKVYRNQGVDINDKHIEVITRQMLKKVRIDDPGDSEFYTASLVDLLEVEARNEELKAEKKKPATYKRVLLGITKASLATDSFLSAASFQETTKVLTEAAIKGKVDNLMGLKENVIIGKLIPTGTGLKRYQEIRINTENENTIEDIVDNSDN